MKKFIFAFVIPLFASCTSVSAQDATAHMSALADDVQDYSSCLWRSFIVSKLLHFNLSEGCWNKMMEKDGWGISTANGVAVDIGIYAKRLGYGDFEDAESANNNDRSANKSRVEGMVDAMRDKFSFTVNSGALKCTNAEWDLLHRYTGYIGEFLK
jgi:hypothetical protein